jgi:hypothetical protein
MDRISRFCLGSLPVKSLTALQCKFLRLYEVIYTLRAFKPLTAIAGALTLSY